MSLPTEPIGRKETYLAKIAGQDVTLPPFPISREEKYLAKIAGEDVDLPVSPTGREETYLAKTAGQDVDLPPYPISRNEFYLAKMEGEDVPLPPNPTSRLSMYLEEIAEKEPTPVVTLKTFDEATEAELVEMVQAADEGWIDLYEDAGWRVGQEREVDIWSIPKTGTYDGVSWNVGNAQSSFTATLVLMARGDSNYSLVTPVLDKQGNQRTIPSFIVGFKDMFPNGEKMNTDGGDSFGWDYCKLRNWCNGGVRSAFRFTTILPIFKKHKVYRVNASNVAIMPGWTEDYFSLPTEYEVTGTRTYSYETEVSNTTHFEWYQNSSNRIKKRYNSSMAMWIPSSYWTRSIKPNDRTYSVYIDTSGVSQYSSYEFEQGVSPFGCV